VASGDPITWADVATRITDSPLTSDSTTWTATESGALITVTPSLITGRRYALNFFGNISSDVPADTAILRIREDSAAGTQIQFAPIYLNTTSANGYALSMYVEYTAVATGAKIFVVTGQRTVGTGTAHRIRASSSRPAYLRVDRIVS